MTNRLLFGLIIFIIFIFIEISNSSQITSLSKAEELKLINKLKFEIDDLKKNLTNFYNYSIICGGKTYESRADRGFTDKTIPQKFKDIVLSTYMRPELRANRCPKWSYNVETVPRSGGMDTLTIPENTKPGQKVYLLLAIDPESDPVFYFIRKAESELKENADEEDIIFKVNVIKMGNSWFGEVILDKELDYEKKQSYNYLAYAYDGSNLLEKYSTIEITDVDDEKPVILTTNHKNYNLSTKQFEFKIYENMSIGEIINSDNKITFTDVDTQSSQLNIRLTNLESGLADSPFNLNNNGELRLIGGLDYENQKEYLLKLVVRDGSGGSTEEIIKIDILDVPDLAPKFIEPKILIHDFKNQLISDQIENRLSFLNLNEEGYVLFYENKIGPVFNITAISLNREPLGKIRYELVENLNKNYQKDFFELKKYENSDIWYLNCLKEINLNDKEEEYLQFVIRAVEAPDESSRDSKNYLYSDKRVTVKVVNGDLCIPNFNKDLYEFEVVENIKQLLEPIYVSDCDHGINGRVFLSTTNKDFSFKIDQVYRYSKLGIDMERSFDYEDNLTTDGHIIEFEIIARGSNQSLNKYESRALVRIKILDKNEFIPQFVMPSPIYFLKDGIPTKQVQRIFLYNVAERQDFVLDVKAEDSDKGGDVELFYFCRYLHPEDTFEIIHNYNSSSKIFNIRIPGRYFDANSKIPIAFAVFVEDSKDEPKLRNEILIYLRPQSIEQKSAYFEFSQYEFKLREKSDHFQTFKLKLINDNLNISKIQLEELYDPLNLLKPDYEETSISTRDMVSIVEKEELLDNDLEIENELMVILYPTDSNLDFDQLYLDNNKSDIYTYKLRVRLIERPDLYSDVTVLIKLIDSNDNEPTMINLPNIDQYPYLNATLNEDFAPNTLIDINNTHFIPKIADMDFSPELGIRSLNFKINDTRFYIDNEFISSELENPNVQSVSLLIRILTSTDRINKQIEPVIWLNVTCEDNYFNRKLTRQHLDETYWMKSFLIRLEIVDSLISSNTEIFDSNEYLFKVDENWTGPLGLIGKTSKLPVKYKIEGYSQEQTQLLNDYFELNDNLISLKKEFDFELGQHFYNFTLTATILTGSSVLRTNVVVLVNDLNDEKPNFAQKKYTFYLNQKNKFNGNQIGAVYATDMDRQDWENGLNFTSLSKKLKLEKIENNKESMLQGVSIIIQEDLTEQDNYNFEIEVSDKVGHKSTSEIQIIIENEQPFDELKWSKESYSVIIKENSPSDSVVIKVNMQPKGLSNPKAVIGYKIVNENKYYKINQSTGEITTTNVKLNREESSLYEQNEQKILFLQSFVTINYSVYWSKIITVNIEILDENDESPIFIQPLNNLTQTTLSKADNIFTFIATDSDLNDKITYTLREQILFFSNTSINLPFKLEPENGILSFEIKNLKNEDYLMMLKQEADSIRIKLNVRATDLESNFAECSLLVDLSINRLIKKLSNKADISHLSPIVYKLESKIPGLEQINNSYYSIDESVPANTIIAEVNSYIEKTNVGLRMNENLKIISSRNDSINPELYFKYDHVTNSLKLIRKLDYDLVKNLSLSLAGDDDFRIDMVFVVNDKNDKKPKLELDEEEINKYGENLVIVSIQNLDQYINSISTVMSSTPAPPRLPLPAIPELNFPKGPENPFGHQKPELDENEKSLFNFEQVKLIKAYKILDSDKENNFQVKFVSNETTEALIKCFILSTNGTHVLFEKNKQTTPEDEANLEENIHNKFKIELSDGVNKDYFSGELYKVDARQLQRLSTFVPQNGRYKSSLYRSSEPNTKIELQPMIQIENQFPYDLVLNLEGKHSKYFSVSPRVIRSSSINFGPSEIVLTLKNSLDDFEDELAGLIRLEFSIQLSTSNEYINTLLKTIGNLKIRIDLKNLNKFQPKIESVIPGDKIIKLEEGIYSKKEIAKIQAFDPDRGDPGRLEYFLIGNSNLLEINQDTGVVYLNGTLDAESEQSIIFFCYARDLAPQPFGRNSELVRFEIQISDINEYNPILQPGLTSLTLKEAVEGSPDLNVIDEFRYDCYDRDLDSKLVISLDSIRYVSKHDTFKYMDEDLTSQNQHQIKDLFRLVYENTTLIKNYKSAYLAYTSKLDYEKLFKPSETLIRIDVSCTDGKFESKSKLFVKVEDINDNRPQFVEKSLIIKKNESNVLETIGRVQAIDMDQSAQFGNQSLKYKIDKCQPNNYDIYIDERTGDISSKLLIDLDTDEIIKKRKEIYTNQLSRNEQLEFLNVYNRINCQISVHDAGLYTLSSNETSLSDSMNLTILINNMNDNPPDINLDKQENLIEVKEGEQTRGVILQQISVFDKDGASDLECLFGNGHKTSDPFELRTSLDLNDPHTAWCILKVRDDMIVDYDIVKKSVYILELVVTDNTPPPAYPNTGISRAQIRIRVIPVNNKPPLFVNGNEETFYVLDSIRPGSLIGTVLATDMENPNPDRLIYAFDSFLQANIHEVFELRQNQNTTNSYWGSVGLFTKSKLSVSESPYVLTIIAYDGPIGLKDTLFSRKLIKVYVLNKGSMSVWINQTNGMPVDYYLVNIEEELLPETFIVKVKANIDTNLQKNRQIIDYEDVIYSIVGEDENSNQTNPYYKIDSLTGEIRTTGERIDFENKNLDQIKLMRNIKIKAATLDGIFSYITHVSINILDINDNKPAFEFRDYKFYVVENSTESKIGAVKAFDLDSGENGLVKYKIDNSLFFINEITGELSIIYGNKIDRESNETIRVKITAYDKDDLEDEIELNIIVLDINDNEPIFAPSSFEKDFVIDENSLDFKLKLNATDPDLAQNGTLFFYFDKSLNSFDISQKFRIDPLTGLIELASPLDYEIKNEYKLYITCSDNGTPEKLKSNIDITIKVNDLNDNGPKFSLSTKNKAKIYINEATPVGTIITKLEAIDLDSTESFKQVKYQINSINLVKSGELISKQIDLFLIDSNGQITLGRAGQLDYQSEREYLIEIEAFDQNKLEFSDIFKLNILIEPSNDKLPVFEHFTGGSRQTVLYRRSLAESRENDYVIDIVKAVDPNQHGVKYYLDKIVEIDSHNHTRDMPNDLFSIGVEDGAVKTRKIRSFYSGDKYVLSIRAVSKLNDTLNSTTNLIVVVDSNIDSLFQDRVIEVSIDENLASNTEVTRLIPKSTDRKLRYSLNKEYSTPIELYSKWFKINYSTGLITTNHKSEIDCEISNEVLLSVDVIDEEKLVVVENLIVKIKINDLNDNLPIFDLNYNYEPRLVEDDNSTVSTERLITKFKAVDNDRTLANSEINYKIDSIGNLSPNSFKLTLELNGEVSLFKRRGVNLDRDSPSIGSKIKLIIRAENTKDKSKFTEKEITINLIDLNDNPPILVDNEPETVISLPEDFKINEKFYQIKAIDLDEPQTVNSELVYDITSKSSQIQIDQNGYLFLTSELDYEKNKQIQLIVNIFDKSTKPLFTTKKLKINIQNVNDNKPTFVELPNELNDKKYECSFSLSENLNKKVLFSLNAFDLDSSDGFKFEIVSLKTFDSKSDKFITLNNDVFDINSSSGEFNLIGNLDREIIDNYILKLSVQDKEIDGITQKTDTECLIKILDVNDNKPEFSPNVKTEFKILPIVNERTLIGYFAATDIDLGLNSTIEYSILDNKNLFEIDSNSYLFLNLKKANKNHDLDDLYDLSIIAQDMGTPKRLQTTLKIRVQIDQNYFTFDQQNSDKLDIQTQDVIRINENSLPGTRVGQVRVLNAFKTIIEESNKNQNRIIDLKFSLLTCNDVFKINELNGFIEVLNSTKLDYEVNKEFLVVVEARELQQMSSFTKIRTGKNSFIVKLNNLNDNPVVFSRNLYETSLNENQNHLPFELNLNEVIQLIDLDLETSRSQALDQLNPIDLRLTGSDSSSFRLIKLNAFLYKIESIEKFDYEFKTKYEFSLDAWDGKFRSTAKVVVNILDENDNKPIFEQNEYVFRIDENSPMNTEIGFVKAIDLDITEQNNRVYYKITNSHENVFGLNEKTGLWYVRDSQRLDREETQSFNLTITSSNIGKPEFYDTARVIIYLNDLNDQSPKFDSSVLRINIKEKYTELPRLIGRVHAVDNDLNENGTVNYYIESVNGKTYDLLDSNENVTDFYMQKSTGLIYLNSYLDADSNSVDKSYEIKILAKDLGGNQDEALILVNLIDINDHTPVISSHISNEYKFDENSNYEDFLFEIKAYDPDYRQSQIYYFIEKDLVDDWSHFRIDQTTGKVYSNAMFDYETKSEYNLRIVCKDSGIMVDLDSENENNYLIVNDLQKLNKLDLKTEFRVKIKINDLDDNEPEFDKSEKELVIDMSENLETGSIVTVLPIARDRDTLPENTNIKYYITSGNEDSKFRLNETSGELALIDELERKEKNFYELNIQATSKLFSEMIITNDKSVLNLKLNVVKDKLFIEFDEQNYYVSAKMNEELNTNETLHKLYKFEDLETKTSSMKSTIDSDYFKKSAIFYSKSHLIKRRLKRSVKFGIEMIQIIRGNDNNLATKLPLSLISKLNHSYSDEFINQPDDSMNYLFTIDESNGKIYLNREFAKKENYKIGDRFVLTVSASSTNMYSDDTENTLTQLTVRLTDKEYSFMMPLKRLNLKDIQLEALNPLKPNYIPRVLQADGVKIAIQDLISIVSKLTGETTYSLILQVEAKQERKTLDLDLFVNMWKNYSASNRFLNEFHDGFIDRRPISDARRFEKNDFFDMYRPFYSSWLFWLLFIIGVLLIIILFFFVFCIKVTRKQSKKMKKPGIIIEYPPGVNPVYNDGVLSLKNKSSNNLNTKEVPVEINQSPISVNSYDVYEEKEFQIDFDDEDEDVNV